MWPNSTQVRKDTPLFRTAYRKAGRLTKNTMDVIDAQP